MPNKINPNSDYTFAAPTLRRKKRASEGDFAFKNLKNKERSVAGKSAAEERLKSTQKSSSLDDAAKTKAVEPPPAAGKTEDSPKLVFQNEAVSVKKKKDKKIETWLQRRAHAITYPLLFSFTLVLYFRPYEWYPSLEPFAAAAFYLALGTILVFIPSQFAAENSFTARPAEVNYVLLLTLFGLITIPIARNPALAWQTFNDPFIKVILIFIVIINTVRTELRLKGLIWLSFAVGVTLSIENLQNYASGKNMLEGYRAAAQVFGMFGTPNTQALHLVTMMPLALTLGLASRNWLLKILYFALVLLFIGGNMVTFSRGGFLGMVAVFLVLAWKLGRHHRFKAMLLFGVSSLAFMAFAPGNYGTRVLSIFIPSLDEVGSSDHRKELLITSVIVTLRNPWGIGMGNFVTANAAMFQTHNSFTQISSEMGVLALFCFLMFLFEPIRRLFWIERDFALQNSQEWIYYLSIGLQAGLVGFCVAGFFDAAGYMWFAYYLVGYSIALRRIHHIQMQKKEDSQIFQTV